MAKASPAAQLRVLRKVFTGPLMYANALLFWPCFAAIACIVIDSSRQTPSLLVWDLAVWIALLITYYSLATEYRKEGYARAYRTTVFMCALFVWFLFVEVLWHFGGLLYPELLWLKRTLIAFPFLCWCANLY